MNNNHKGTNFEDFLIKELIDIDDKDILIKQLNQYKQYKQLCK